MKNTAPPKRARSRWEGIRNIRIRIQEAGKRARKSGTTTRPLRFPRSPKNGTRSSRLCISSCLVDGKRSTSSIRHMTATRGGEKKDSRGNPFRIPEAVFFHCLKKLTFCSLGRSELRILPQPFYGLAILSTNRQQGGLLLSPLPVPNLKPYKTHFQSQATTENHRKQPVSEIFGRFFKLFAIAENIGHICVS